MQHPTLSVIVPVRNEHPRILDNLTVLASINNVMEVIVVDFSDQQATLNKLKELGDRFSSLKITRAALRGRAYQMNIGAKLASGDIVWFVHADTVVPATASESILESVSNNQPWGRFDIQFDNSSARMQLVALTMNLRSRLTGICTGDQAIFVSRALFEKVGGFPEIPIMEDVALTKRLKREASVMPIRTPITTSARRWETHGYVKTILNMWLLRFLFWVGVPPQVLSKLYR